MEKKLKSKVVGGHTIYCDWPLFGGEASGFIHKDKIIRKSGVKKGDKLILTKPIGLQAVMAAYRILKEMPEMLDRYSVSELKSSIRYAIELMRTPNQDVVKTIHSYDDFSFVHAMTDVTGFGLAGHTREMLQNSELSAKIEKIPSIKLSKELSEELGYAYDDCTCHETAGGMLIAVDNKNLEDFCNALKSNGVKNWIVGTIGQLKPGSVNISENVENIEILND
ncbi:MAG: hypothetical protein EU539_09350 [Promethearchaeota archaeon]|nr:MAG: hypothetical protein EU539_09350 [Candidatus Lokiarchaeota archaeon]